MNDPLSAAVGRLVRGVVDLGPRAFAIPLVDERRSTLWFLLGPRDVRCALAERLPAPPDARGSRLDLLERTVRGARVREIVVEEARLTVGLEPRAEGLLPLAVVLTAEERPANAHLVEEGGRRIWSLLPRREPAARAGRVHVAGDGAALAALREEIARSFREDFDRMIGRALDAAERQLTRREGAAQGDQERARARREDRRKGEILLAHFHEVPRGAGRIGLPDPYADPPTVIELSLDPALSPQENAARLFQSAKRGERGEQRATDRLESTRNLLAELAQARREIASAAPKEALQRLGAFLRVADLTVRIARGDGQETRLGLQRAQAVPRAEHPGRRPPGARKSIGPRTFKTSDGWEVWVGRNNVDNDRITHRLSNPHDFWFHAVGVPGSHVILRRPARNAVPRQSALVEAAEMAAWFSQGRKLTRVPVIYTERKFVSKPRRAKPGQAICSREREILVRPRKPGSETGTADEG